MDNFDQHCEIIGQKSRYLKKVNTDIFSPICVHNLANIYEKFLALLLAKKCVFVISQVFEQKERFSILLVIFWHKTGQKFLTQNFFRFCFVIIWSKRTSLYLKTPNDLK